MNFPDHLDQNFQRILQQELNTRGFYDLVFEISISEKNHRLILTEKFIFKLSEINFFTVREVKVILKVEILKIWIIETTCIEVLPSFPFAFFVALTLFFHKLICKLIRAKWTRISNMDKIFV